MQNSDSPMIVRDAADGGFVWVNRLFTERLGWTAEDLVEKPLAHWVDEADRLSLKAALDAGHGKVRSRHLGQDRDPISLDWTIRTEEHGLVALGVLAGNDTSCAVKAETVLPAGDSLGETLTALALIIEDQHPGRYCSILLLDEDRQRVSVGAGPSLPAEYNAAVEGLAIGPSVGSCGTAAYWGQRVLVENIQEEGLWRDLKQYAAMAGVAACWSHPIINSRTGEVLGALALYNSVPSAPSPRELSGLEMAAKMVALAIERGRAEQTLRETEDHLRQAAKMEAIGVLAGGVAHDFNNMLAVMQGNAELALDMLPEGTKVRPLLSEILAASEKSHELCNQMLAYAGRGSRSTHLLDINSLIRELGNLQKVTLSKKAYLEYDLSPEPMFVEADRAQMNQVVMNLITNAAEALGDGEGNIVVTTSAQTFDRQELDRHHGRVKLETGEYVRMEVSDTGCGMDLKTVERIYDPFFTTKFAGRGLGLAAVQGIVRGHKGAINVESEDGRGTIFAVLLPRVRASAACSEVRQSKLIARGAMGKRILVVDDEPAVREVQARLLERAGYDVLSASDGQEAVEIFEREGDSIDCVLLDFSMPRLDGEETMHALRKLRGDVCVVLTSGFTEQEMLNRSSANGFNAIIHKPFARAALLKTIREVLV